MASVSHSSQVLKNPKDHTQEYEILPLPILPIFLLYECDKTKFVNPFYPFRLASSKSGKIYLHTDVRMIIFRKSDLDTAADHESGKGFELRLEMKPF